MLNKIYIFNIATLFVLKFYIVAVTSQDTSLMYGVIMQILLHMKCL